MTTWAQLLLELRTDLKDTGDKPKWPDPLLFIFTKDAIRDYSLFFPRMMMRVGLVEQDSTYILPDDYVRAVEVECPKDSFLEQRQERPGVRFHSQGDATLYYIGHGLLHLNGTPKGDVLLTYEAVHAIPASVDDIEAVLSVPLVDEELIRLYVKAKAYEYVRGPQANLDRHKIGSGSRDDNPVMPEVRDLMREYRRKIAERTLGGGVMLWRPGRRR
jgi:hypothetical protein